MPNVIFIAADGGQTTIDIAAGESVMRGAVNGGIDGIEAECGGSLACATCHVYVDDAWAGRFAAKSETEIDMLDCAAAEVRATSRLSCQLELTDAHDGLVVRLPNTQS